MRNPTCQPSGSHPIVLLFSSSGKVGKARADLKKFDVIMKRGADNRHARLTRA
jgi:hypothetical protein